MLTNLPKSSSCYLVPILCFILIQLGCDSLTFDPETIQTESDSDEEIFESLTIIYPIGGESFDPGTIVTITWESTANPCEWGVNLVLIHDGDVLFNIATNTTNDGTFDWYIDPSLLSGEKYQIRLNGLCYDGDYCNACINDQMTTSFFVTQNVVEPYITVISPNGGENFEMEGESILIRWDTNLPDCFFGFKIDLYLDTTYIAGLGTGVVNDGTHTVSINSDLGLTTNNQYKIWVESLCGNSTTYCGGCYGDFSDESFRLYSNKLKLISPNGGEEWTRGETETIFWTNDSTTQNVRLELWKSGSKLQDIYYLLENDFSYDWAPLIAFTPDNDYKIKVISWESNESDLSDEPFTIE